MVKIWPTGEPFLCLKVFKFKSSLKLYWPSKFCWQAAVSLQDTSLQPLAEICKYWNGWILNGSIGGMITAPEKMVLCSGNPHCVMWSWSPPHKADSHAWQSLAPTANVFPPLGRIRTSGISSCLFNYIPRMDCTLVLTINQTSKNATIGKLDQPSELCQTREHMHWEARQFSAHKMPNEDLPSQIVSTCSGLRKCCTQCQEWQGS